MNLREYRSGLRTQTMVGLAIDAVVIFVLGISLAFFTEETAVTDWLLFCAIIWLADIKSELRAARINAFSVAIHAEEGLTDA